MTVRPDGRRRDALRPVSFQPHFQTHPAGSVLVACGGTRVICSVSAVPGVPRWLGNEAGRGWLTAEYQMLPGATADRSQREVTAGKPSGRTAEIQRLIGRSLRAAVDLSRVPGITLCIDCDVVDADGGTRCAAIVGSSVALEIALLGLLEAGRIRDWPMVRRVAAVSVGIVDGEATLDLCYAEDSAAEVDLNVVMATGGRFIEIQGTAEATPFSPEQLEAMLALARGGIDTLLQLQDAAVKTASRELQCHVP